MDLKKSLVVNFSWLAVSQGINFIIPLVIYPYLLRVTGVELFGLIVFTQAIVTYFVYLVDYGYSITAVRETSVYRTDKDKLSILFTRVYGTKLFLSLICLVVFISLIISIPKWNAEFFLFISTFSLVIGQLILPVWFFQGLEKMNGIAIMNVLSKLLFTVLIFLFIHNPQDYVFANLYLGISQVCIGSLSIIYILIIYKLKPVFKPGVISTELKENRSIFLSGFSVFVANNSNLMILGLIADPVSVGYYGIVDKILLAIRAPAILVYQTIFPRVCLLAEQSIDHVKRFLKKIVRLAYLTFIPLSLTVFFCSRFIVYLFAGEYLTVPTSLLQLVCAIPLFATLSIPATHTLLAYNLKKTYAQLTTSGAVFNIAANLVLVYFYSVTGTAIAALLTELFICTSLPFGLFFRHKKYSVLGAYNPF